MYVISLFDYTLTMLKPWADAGFDCIAIDIQHTSDSVDGITTINYDLSKPLVLDIDKSDIAFVAAFPPCDHLAVSGSRWFKGKGLRKLASSIEMFATAAEFCEWSEAPYMIENPISTISTYWRKPDYKFHPHHFTRYCSNDNYTKNTCLWTNELFIMPEISKDKSLGPPDKKYIHNQPDSAGRKNVRSATPEGFAQAVFEANNPLGFKTV